MARQKNYGTLCEKIEKLEKKVAAHDENVRRLAELRRERAEFESEENREKIAAMLAAREAERDRLAALLAGFENSDEDSETETEGIESLDV